MPWISCKAYRVDQDEKLIALGVDPKEEDFYWAETFIRSEDVKEFYKMNNSKTILSFYDERTNMVIKESLQEFFQKIEHADYDDLPGMVILPDNEEDEKIL